MAAKLVVMGSNPEAPTTVASVEDFKKSAVCGDPVCKEFANAIAPIFTVTAPNCSFDGWTVVVDNSTIIEPVNPKKLSDGLTKRTPLDVFQSLVTSWNGAQCSSAPPRS